MIISDLNTLSSNKMPSYNDAARIAAVNAVRNGQSQLSAARDYGVPRSTIRRHLRGAETCKTAHEFQQRLLSIQEEALVNWALIQGSIGLPPTHAQLRHIALRVL